MVLGLLLAATFGISAVNAGIQHDGPQLPAKMVEAIEAQYADCVVTSPSYKTYVLRFLRMVPGTQPWVAAGFRSADPTCLNEAARLTQVGMAMKISPSSFRDALYPALYRRRFARTPQVARIAALPPLGLTGEFDGDIAALPAEYRPRRALGDCVARAQPGAVHSMLLAIPWSKQEDAAVAELKPAIAACLPAGVTLRMNRAALRAYTGEAMYKLSEAAAAGVPPI